MSATILDGKSLATQIEAELAVEVAEFIENNAHEPTLAAVLVGDDPASAVYVKNKRLACERTGIERRLHRLPSSTTEEELLDLVAELNSDDEVPASSCSCPCRCRFASKRCSTRSIR